MADPITAVAEASPAWSAEPVMSCTARVETVTAAMNPVVPKPAPEKRTAVNRRRGSTI
jgi:hypothetical protein